MSVEIDQRLRPLPALLDEVKGLIVGEMQGRMAAEGHPDIRPGHGCVFRFVDRERGSRLTELAEASGLTKQAVGEVVADLERMGYLERVPDPEDGRAKIIRLTGRGRDGCDTAERLLAEIERRWADQVGEELLAGMRAAAERILELEPARSAA